MNTRKLNLWWWRHGLLVVCLALLPTLTGCLLLPVVAVGFGATKLVQMNMKSTFDVKFDPPAIANAKAIVSVTKLALWPEASMNSPLGQQQTMVSAPMLAERLSQSGKLAVVTPFMVAQVLQSNAIPQSLQDMTATEKFNSCKLVAERTGANAILYTLSPDIKSDMRALSFKRPSMTYSTALYLYSATEGGLIWQTIVTIVVKQGGTMPSQADIQAAGTAAVADKLLEITGTKPVSISAPAK